MDEQKKYPKYYNCDTNTYDKESLYLPLFREMYELRKDDAFECFIKHFSDGVGEKLKYYCKCIELEEIGHFAKELACEQNGKIYYKLENNGKLLDLTAKIYFYTFCLKNILVKDDSGNSRYNSIFSFWNKISKKVITDISEIYDYYGGNPDFVDICSIYYDPTNKDFLFEKLLEELYVLRNDENLEAFLSVLDKYVPQHGFYYGNLYIAESQISKDIKYYLKCIAIEKTGFFEEENVYYKDNFIYESLDGKEYIIDYTLNKLSQTVDKIIVNGQEAETFYRELDFTENQLDKKTSLTGNLPHLYSIEAEFEEYLKDYRIVNKFWSKLPSELTNALSAFYQFNRLFDNMMDIQDKESYYE